MHEKRIHAIMQKIDINVCGWTMGYTHDGNVVGTVEGEEGPSLCRVLIPDIHSGLTE